MKTFCVQCAMKAMNEGKTSVMFNESPEEHQQRCHPDLEATARERKEIERVFIENTNREIVEIIKAKTKS